MKTKDIVKGIVKLGTQYGLINAGLRVADAYTERGCGFFTRLAIKFGVILLGFAVGDSAAEYTFDYTDRIVKAMTDDDESVIETVVKN